MRLAFLCVLLGVVATTNPEELPASVVNSFDCEEGLQTKTISDAAREVSKEKARKVIERAISGWAIRRRQKRKVSAIIDEPSNRSKEIVEPSDPTLAFSNLCDRAILRRLAAIAVGLGVLTVVASETLVPLLYCLLFTPVSPEFLKEWARKFAFSKTGQRILDNLWKVRQCTHGKFCSF